MNSETSNLPTGWQEAIEQQFNAKNARFSAQMLRSAAKAIEEAANNGLMADVGILPGTGAKTPNGTYLTPELVHTAQQLSQIATATELTPHQIFLLSAQTLVLPSKEPILQQRTSFGDAFLAYATIQIDNQLPETDELPPFLAKR